MIQSAKNIRLAVTVPDGLRGSRLDQAASTLIGDYSRSRLQHWIRAGALTVNGQKWRPRDKLAGGELLAVDAEPEPEGDWQAQDLPLTVVHEDDALLVLNKPAGLVVHPAAGNPAGTLVNALLNYCPDLAALPRAGIVHRLDKDTTGLMVVAKTLKAHHFLVDQLQQRLISREYEAVVQGVMTGGGSVRADIGRHPRVRTKMAVVSRGGKPAVSHYRVLQRFAAHSHLRVQLETGRTHQIRVHMAHIGYPLVGDGTYGGRLRLPPSASPEQLAVLMNFSRQALHAAQLVLEHPESGARLSCRAPLPDDFLELLRVLGSDMRSPEAGAAHD